MNKITFRPGHEYSFTIERSGVAAVARRLPGTEDWAVMEGDEIVCRCSDRADLEHQWGPLVDMNEVELG